MTRVAERSAELVAFARDGLPEMLLPDGLFCHELVAAGAHESGGRLGRGSRHDERAILGSSVRYSLICLLGCRRAEAETVAPPIDVDALERRLTALAPYEELTAGELGLLLWALARSGAEGDVAPVLGALSAALAGNRPYALETLELCWAAVGAARALEAGIGERGALERLADELRGRLLARAETPSGLLLNSDGGRRSILPHFATGIYGVHALATLGALRADEAALAAATRLADALIAARLPDGAWPWILDSRTGTVVEAYRLYSVHQNAMAPLALFELAEATGERRFAAAAAEGVEWVFGANELGVSLLDREQRLLARSINRRGVADRAALWANSASALAFGRPLAGPARRAELERTDRPYHLGWILEAWCDRDLGALGLA